jgi:hypothetical protein
MTAIASTETDRHEAPGPRTIIVHGNAAGFAQEIAIGQHRLAADEPSSVGGTDTGPNPYDLLLAALGACTSMTVAMYARRKNWPLESVTVRLSRGLRNEGRSARSCPSRRRSHWRAQRGPAGTAAGHRDQVPGASHTGIRDRNRDAFDRTRPLNKPISNPRNQLEVSLKLSLPAPETAHPEPTAANLIGSTK